jgi:hypothetical protein
MKVVLKRRKRVRLPKSQTFISGDTNERLLEDGDTRITESGDIRILE